MFSKRFEHGYIFYLYASLIPFKMKISRWEGAPLSNWVLRTQVDLNKQANTCFGENLQRHLGALIFLPPKKFVTKSLEANRSRPEWPCHCLTSDWRTTYCKALISNISLSCKFAFLGILCWVTGGGFTSEFPAMAELSLRLHMFPL